MRLNDSDLFFSLDGPLDALPADLQTRAANLLGFPNLAREMGVDPRRILEHHGVDPLTVGDPDQLLPCKSLVDILEYSSDIFDDPLFGLRLANLQEPDVFGCVTALCRAAPTVREGLLKLAEFMPVAHSPESAIELRETRDVAELRLGVRADLGVNDQAQYQSLVLNLKFIKMLAGPDFRPSYAHLSVDARQHDLAEIESIVGCRVHSGAPMNMIGFAAHTLDRAVPTANKLLFRLIGGYLDRVKVASRRTIVERVEDYVRGALPSGDCSIERCARKLGMSVRTIQSRLSEGGLRFSDIVERQRAQMARVLLGEDALSLDEIALFLGYSEQTSFGRAFKRWTGVTPQRFRAEGARSGRSDH